LEHARRKNKGWQKIFLRSTSAHLLIVFLCEVHVNPKTAPPFLSIYTNICLLQRERGDLHDSFMSPEHTPTVKKVQGKLIKAPKVNEGLDFFFQAPLGDAAQ
jgi:hypothetical protein